jgi:glycosyltransferase involved in cell wall biosynthesis
VDLVDRLEIDVLHTSEFRSNLLALLCRQRRPLTLVSTAHGWITNNLRGHVYCWADRVMLRWFDRVILVSHAMRRRLPSWWVPERTVRVLHNALMTDSYGSAVLGQRRETQGRSGQVRLLNVGRLSPEKGQDLLLRSVAALTPEYPSLQLIFAGIGPFELTLRQLAQQLGIADRVQFAGYVSDMPSLYASVDVVVQSSLTEGLPNVMLEAAYLGVPIIATDVGGTREVVEHGVSGWLIEPGDTVVLAEALRKYVSAPGYFIEMAARGRGRIESEFAFPTRTEKQTEIYRELLKDY